MRRTVYSLFLLLYIVPFLQADHYAFRLYLKDKGHCVYDLNQPEGFLSDKAIQRRQRQGIVVDSTDLPISASYLQAVEQMGGTIVAQSKWLSTLVVQLKDCTQIETIKQLSFVEHVRYVWKGKINVTTSEETQYCKFLNTEPVSNKYYGRSEKQIKMLNGIKLHKAGFCGKGMTIAVLDEGFQHVNRIEAFDSIHIIGTKNVVEPSASVYEKDNHGTKVLSCLAAKAPYRYVGTAPEASYWLIRTEDSRSEYPIEEDYWVAGMEFADSVGVDVVSSSLGYYAFDDTLTTSYRRCDLNGYSAHITKGAQFAASKGMLIFSSAGNEGNGSWKAITFPADCPDVFTVGAVTEKGKTSSFSSLGFIRSAYVKPNAVALGTNATIVSPDGEIVTASGTSYATPILAGLAACLWQALPHLNPKELQALLEKSAKYYKKPSPEQGYGLPDVYKAYKKGK